MDMMRNKRKIRKGTQSCWACKRRKVRCEFTPGEQICDGCRRRKTVCVGQEFDDEQVGPVFRDQSMNNRLDRLEIAVERLTRKVDGAVEAEDHLNHSSSTDNMTNRMALDSHGMRKHDHFQTVNSFFENTETDELSYKLILGWPSERDLEIILRTPDQLSGSCLLHTINTLESDITSIQDILRLPPLGSRPILIAQKLLMLATYLQGFSSDGIRCLRLSEVDCDKIMGSAVDTVYENVTCNDHLLGSIEGIDCLMMECMYKHNAGNLRDAWHIIRRAMLVAQMMGLCHSLNQASHRDIWFRVIQLDRYLSMMLGLPQGSAKNDFADCKVLRNCSPVERMRRIDCVAAGFILQRNEMGLYNTSTTSAIDGLLQMSSSLMPSKWWLGYTQDSTTGQEASSLDLIMPIMDQFTHYHLIAQLHLPFLLQSSTDHKFDFSKIAVLNASREVLSRFISLRDSHIITSFCRGINLLAFVACTVICTAHIDAHQQSQHQFHTGGLRSSIVDSLRQQHHTDRGLLELTLDSMEHASHQSNDTIASKIVKILTQLLCIEADVTVHGQNCARLSIDYHQNETECGGKMSDCGQMFEVYIPHFGAVKFERKTSRADQPSLSSMVSADPSPGVSESWELHEHCYNPLYHCDIQQYNDLTSQDAYQEVELNNFFSYSSSLWL